jgi:hypothetical protein
MVLLTIEFNVSDPSYIWSAISSRWIVGRASTRRCSSRRRSLRHEERRLGVYYSGRDRYQRSESKAKRRLGPNGISSYGTPQFWLPCPSFQPLSLLRTDADRLCLTRRALLAVNVSSAISSTYLRTRQQAFAVHHSQKKSRRKTSSIFGPMDSADFRRELPK